MASLRVLYPQRSLLLLVLALVLATACRRDRLFTDDPGAQLSFSRDTVMFDTVFAGNPGGFSVTKYFVARNTNSRAVRVDIALAGGAPSPFRINVDGASGTSFSQVEILGGDSIFIFVEANLDQGNQSSPLVHEDHIVFHTNGNVQEVLLVAWGQDAYYHTIGPDSIQIPGFPPIGIVAGRDASGNVICETVTWANDKPHVIFGYAVVDSCSTLEIQPGTRIHVHGGGGLWVYRWGRLLAQGTLDMPITFQSDRLEPLYAELPGQWDRIWLNDGPAGADHVMDHVVIKNALVGIQCEPGPWLWANGQPAQPISQARLILNNTQIRNCSAVGLLSRNYRIFSNNLLVGDCGQHAVALTGGGGYLFNHATVANYWDLDGRETPAFVLTNRYQDQYTGALITYAIDDTSRFVNGIIHGANSNEFTMAFDMGAAPQFTFDRYIIRTTESTSNTDWFPAQDRIYRNASPGFVSASARNFRLSQNSFARNKGTFVNVYGGISDIEGNSRNCDAGMPESGYDLGCYEWCP